MPRSEPRLPSLPNLRDLGGHHTADNRRLRHGILFRSEAPALATPADQRALHDRLGIREVIDLRRAEEHAAAPLPPAIAHVTRWHRVPFEVDAPPHVTDWSLPPGKAVGADMGRFYAWMAQHNVPQLREVLGLLAAAEAPALVHCAVGKDRTGVTIALTLLAVHVGVDDVVADYACSDEPMRQVLPRHDDRIDPDHIDGDARLRAPASAMSTFLDALAEAYGSVAAFLDTLDADGSTRRGLRDRLTEHG